MYACIKKCVERCFLTLRIQVDVLLIFLSPARKIGAEEEFERDAQKVNAQRERAILFRVRTVRCSLEGITRLLVRARIAHISCSPVQEVQGGDKRKKIGRKKKKKINQCR